MPPPPHTKPENVLKRGQELIAVGQSPAALSLLHEHVTAKRTRNSPITSLEPVMVLFVELCVDLRKGKSAKDGLYQYKNIAQNTNVGTIEMVLKKFIELAEQKVTEAQTKADEVHSTIENATTNIEDLEASETPESILLSAVSGEQSRDRTDRAIVTPWLKFLWETYRTVLDILRNNARLEIMYQTTALQAFQFCLKYTRKTEFRRLCDLLRNHVQNATKYASQMHAINLNDPDTLQRHLDTRFQQLNVAVELELWQEAFRSIEDIHTLLSMSKRPAKNVMMANYYEKLTRVFMVSENYLFHAAAWSRYYNLLLRSAAAVSAAGPAAKKDNPTVSETEMTKAASFVLLSALAIPVISTSRSRGALIDVDENKKTKNTRLTNLLGMSQAPSRAILFRDAMSKGILKRVHPEIRELYNILEVDFHPLSICKKISPILGQIGKDPEMEKYVVPLQQVILTRLFQQLSQVYESVSLKFVQDLAQFPEPFQVTSSTIEKFIMNGCKKGDLAIRLDHAAGVLTFDSDVFSSSKALHSGSGAGSAETETGNVQRLQSTPSEIVRSQLTRLAKSLYITCQYTDPSFNAARAQAKAEAFSRAQAGAEEEHQATLARRGAIEQKKEAASSALAQREKEEANQKRIRALQQQEAENKRLQQEHQDRERRRLKAEQDRIRQEELKKQLDDLKSGGKGIDVENLDLEELDSNRIRAMKLAQLEKEKTDLSERLRVTGKRIDHLERAFRREEVKHLPEDYEKQKQRDVELYDKYKTETLSEAEIQHKENVALRDRLRRLMPTYEKFRDDIHSRRREEYERQEKIAKRELHQAIEKRRKEHKEAKEREVRAREAAEREAQEEEERLAREAEERAAKEEEQRRKFAEEKAKRDEERRKLDESAARQRQREQEAEEKRKAKTTDTGRTFAARPVRSEAEAPTEDKAPRIPLANATGKLTWREREALRAQEGGAPPSGGNAAAPADGVAAPSAGAGAEGGLPRRTGAWVPPARRNESPAAGSPPPRPGAGAAAGAYRPRARDESPADGGSGPASNRFGSGGRDPRAPRRSESPANAAPRFQARPPRTDASPLPPPSDKPSTDGKYRPGMFRQNREG